MSAVVIRPVPITPERLISSNVPLDDADEWTSGSYALEAKVVYEQHLYQSLVAGNTATPGAETTVVQQWQDLGPVNRHLMFDRRLYSTTGVTYLANRQTVHPNSIEVEINPGQIINAVGAVGINALNFRVIMTDPSEGIVYDRTELMSDAGVADWYEYWFSPFVRKENVALLDLPSYRNATLKIIVEAPEDQAQVGFLVIGEQIAIGETEYGTGLGYDSYSTRKTLFDGTEQLQSRQSRKYVNFNFAIKTDELSFISSQLDALKDTPTLYVGSNKHDGLLIFGIAEKIYAQFDTPPMSHKTLRINSLR